MRKTWYVSKFDCSTRPPLRGDLAIERRRDAEDDRALDLRPDGIGVDDSAAIDRADDPAHAHRAVLPHLNFGNTGHVSREDELQGNAATGSFRQGLAPAGLFSGQIEDGLRARRLVEQCPPIGDWVLLCGRRQFVDEAFGHKDIVRRPDTAPERCRDARRLYL